MAMRGLAHWRGGHAEVGRSLGELRWTWGTSNEVWIVERGDIDMGEAGGAWGKLNGREERWADVEKLVRALPDTAPMNHSQAPCARGGLGPWHACGPRTPSVQSPGGHRRLAGSLKSAESILVPPMRRPCHSEGSSGAPVVGGVYTTCVSPGLNRRIGGSPGLRWDAPRRAKPTAPRPFGPNYGGLLDPSGHQPLKTNKPPGPVWLRLGGIGARLAKAGKLLGPSG